MGIVYIKSSKYIFCFVKQILLRYFWQSFLKKHFPFFSLADTETGCRENLPVRRGEFGMDWEL